jgi:hypothetical protein
MRRPILALTAFAFVAVPAAFVALVPSGPASGEEPGTKKPAATLADLAWLEGSWRSTDGKEIFDEIWTGPEGGSMAAVSRSVEDGRTGMYELSTIETTPTGPVLRIRHFGAGLEPWKSEAAGTPSWPLAKLAGKEVLFEDPSRDFPRSILYRRETGKDGDVLVARLEGKRGDKPVEMEFRLARVSSK